MREDWAMTTTNIKMKKLVLLLFLFPTFSYAGHQTWYFVYPSSTTGNDTISYYCNEYWTDAEKHINYSEYNQKKKTGTSDNNYTVVSDYSASESYHEDYIADLKQMAKKITDSGHEAYFECNEGEDGRFKTKYWWYYVRLNNDELINCWYK